MMKGKRNNNVTRFRNVTGQNTPVTRCYQVQVNLQHRVMIAASPPHITLAKGHKPNERLSSQQLDTIPLTLPACHSVCKNKSANQTPSYLNHYQKTIAVAACFLKSKKYCLRWQAGRLKVYYFIPKVHGVLKVYDRPIMLVFLVQNFIVTVLAKRPQAQRQ